MLEVCRHNNYEMLTEFVDKLMQEGYCVAQVGLMSTLSSSFELNMNREFGLKICMERTPMYMIIQ
jgi:hypothetical protein